MKVREALKEVLAGRELSAAAMEGAMGEILAGEAPASVLGAFAVALRMRGETTEEVAAAARVMRRESRAVSLAEGTVLDTCGTGGDGLGTFNISTVSAIVVAACGVRVAKHGNRAVSSRAGSADVLEALGLPLEITDDKLRRCIEDVGIGFLFAPAHHQALRHAASVRRELGVRTFFNLLGPLANPAAATHQLIGVYDPARVTQTAEVLGELGAEAAWVVHGEGGLDEVAPRGSTKVARLRDGKVDTFALSPADFGHDEVALEALVGGDATENAAIARAILRGEKGPRRIAVLVNAGAALCVAGVVEGPKDGAARAAKAIDEGAADAILDRWIQAAS
ncbi:MAG: anthranilate phosphoribosyltransferase [Myxococcota bacterium]